MRSRAPSALENAIVWHHAAAADDDGMIRWKGTNMDSRASTSRRLHRTWAALHWPHRTTRGCRKWMAHRNAYLNEYNMYVFTQVCICVWMYALSSLEYNLLVQNLLRASYSNSREQWTIISTALLRTWPNLSNPLKESSQHSFLRYIEYIHAFIHSFIHTYAVRIPAACQDSGRWNVCMWLPRNWHRSHENHPPRHHH